MATSSASCASSQATSGPSDPFGIAEELRRAPRPLAGQHSNISEFYRGRNVLITGASGFIGKVLIEKLLRTCPSIGRIYVLVRPKRGKQPSERVRELLESHLFDGVRGGECARAARLEERVVVVEGDVTQANLGLSSYNLARVTKEVSVIFHSAATVKFDEPLKQSVAINIAGTKNMINLCRRIPHLAGLVHVSTAYANCDLDSVDEHVYPVDMDPDRLIQIADWLDQDTLQELKERLLGARPNTYTYTKALAEWLLVKSARDLPVVICRPSIVVASSCEPFRGWIDNVNGPTGVVLGAGKGLIRSMYAETRCVADLVPVDKVINLIVTLGWFAHKYHQATSGKLAAAADERHKLEESLADSLIGSSASSSAASTSGDSLEDREHEEAEEEGEESTANSTSGSLSLETCSSSSSSAAAAAAIASSESGGAEHSPEECVSSASTAAHLFDDGYGSRSPRYASSLASCESATSSLSRRHRQCSDGSTSGCSASDKQQAALVTCEAAMDESPTTGAATATSAGDTNQTTIIITSTGPRSPLTTASNLCDSIQQQQRPTQHLMRMGSPHSFGARREQRQPVDSPDDSSAAQGDLDFKLKEFRQRTKAKLRQKELADELADVPVFHCTSGSENPITWGQVQLFILAALAVFLSTSTYRYPCGSFTNNERLDNFYRITLHYIPGYIADFFTRLLGGRPIIVRLFRKFDQAAHVLKAFTSRDWTFSHENRLFLMHELMSPEDRRLFDCDIKSLDWREFCLYYAAGVRKFLLKEPQDTLEAARKNLKFVFYRNLGLQLVLFATTAHYMATSMGLY